MFYDCEENILTKYLGKYELIKPGPKKIIRAVLKNKNDKKDKNSNIVKYNA